MSLTLSEMIQLIYLLPSLLFMGIVVALLLNKFYIGTPLFCNEFYSLVCFKILNDILYHLNVLLLLKLPLWNRFESIYLNNQVLSTIAYFLGAVTVCTQFLYSFILSLLRFIAIYYPIKYNSMFDIKVTKIIIVSMITFSLCIGFPSIFFESTYILDQNTYEIFPIFLHSNAAYYQMFYTIIIYFPITFASLILNLVNIIGLTNKKIGGNKNSEMAYGLYSLYVFFAACLMELYLLIRIYGTYFENNSLVSLSSNLLTWFGDLATLGDFYIFIFISREIKMLLKQTIRRFLGSRSTKVDSAEIKMTNSSKLMNRRLTLR
uniref:G_PROTEIN_RECEP_F1_2 domain-containing protein n=1 Tax=Parastrongyloides trichosuri TaxID=131310 RepID=A0A0N4Z6W9_PARTI